LSYIISVALIIAGIIHLIPVSGVLGAERLTDLYGIQLTDPNLIVLMRHRAVLFGLLGLFLIFAAFVPQYQMIALIAGLISACSFLYLAWPVSDYSDSIGRVFVADVVAIVSLVVGLFTYLIKAFRP